MICLKIVNLFPKQNRPKIFANKFDHVQIIGKTRSISREPLSLFKQISPLNNFFAGMVGLTSQQVPVPLDNPATPSDKT